MIQKIFLFILAFWLVTLSVSALDTEFLDIRLQSNLEKVESQLTHKSLYRKVFIYTNLKSHTQKYIKYTNISEDKKYIFTQAIDKIQNKIFTLENIITLKNSFIKQDTVSLSFNNSNIDQIIFSNLSSISSAKSIFVFRDSQNLSRKSIQKITGEIRKLNPNILIFIDQEGGQINRYIDFDAEYTKQNLLNNDFIKLRKSKLTQQEYNLFLTLFPESGRYFPSLFQVGSIYDNFDTESAQVVIEMFAYMRLKSHSDSGINTYGLVTDLSRGNPSITPLGRSFSKHTVKYKLLLEAFAKASQETGVLVYLKHFPGVGMGSVDSHNGILDLRNNTQELNENMELFSYARDAFGIYPLGIMLGHVIVPNTLKTQFTEIAQSFDFMITDDLGMQGYSQATGKTFQNGFFSIDELKNSQNLIILDRKSSFYIK